MSDTKSQKSQKSQISNQNLNQLNQDKNEDSQDEDDQQSVQSQQNLIQKDDANQSFSSYNQLNKGEDDNNKSRNLNSSQNLSQSGNMNRSQKNFQEQFDTPKYFEDAQIKQVQSNYQSQVKSSVLEKQDQGQVSSRVDINADQIVLKCNIHRLDIVKVCGKKDCKEKMLFCLECIEEFAEHVVKHRPFIPIKQFFQDLQDNPHTQRKERIEMLQQENSVYVKKFLQSINSEKNRVAQQVIPVLKAALVGLCDQLESRIFDELDQFAQVYQYNSKFLTSYLDQKGLLTEILDQVPSYANLQQKYDENKGSRESEFHDYLEKVYRRVLNNSSVEQTKQAFAYFEEIFEEFRKQGDNAPVFNGEAVLLEKVEQVFNEFIDKKDVRYSSVISQYPICSSCNKEIDSEQSAMQLNYKLKELEAELKILQKTGLTTQSPQSSKRDTASLAAQTTPQSKVGIALNSKTEEIKQIQKEIERLQKAKPGSCRGCRRLICITCQNSSFCKGCKIDFNNSLKTQKFILKENKGFPVAMLDDTSKQQPASSTSQTSYGQNIKLLSISSLLKKLNVGLILGNQELYSGRYEWEVIVENNGQCHSMGFGLCKLDSLKTELEQGKGLKDFSENSSLIVVTSNATISGGLKGRVQPFQKEKHSMAFNCLLDFGKNTFSITGKNVYLEKELENNQGYAPCFYAGCCFKSYNNFTIKQKYQYDPFIISK